MLPLSARNFVTIFVILYCGFCYGFVLISSASAGAQKDIFEAGKTWSYKYGVRVLLNEKGASDKDVGFGVDGGLLVESIWGDGYVRLLKFTLKSPKLSIKTSKTRDGFASHSSKLDSIKEDPFYATWNAGKVEKIYLSKSDGDVSLANLKKGIISLFQFQLLDQELDENDVSGPCKAKYTSTSQTGFLKTKKCQNPDLPHITNPKLLLGTVVDSQSKASYEMDQNIAYISQIELKDVHQIYLTAKEDVGNKIETTQNLIFEREGKCTIVDAGNVEDAIRNIVEEEGLILEDLNSKRETIKGEEVKNFAGVVNDNRDHLKAKKLGSLGSAKSAIPLIRAARMSRQSEIEAVLSTKKNQKILHQLVDILGYTQTVNSHSALMRKIHFDDAKHEELSERYLWACSLASQPDPEIINDLLKKYLKVVSMPEKVKQTLVLSIGSMAYHLSLLPNKPGNTKVINSVKEAIINGLDTAKDEEKPIFLRALRNLRIKSIVPTLIEIIRSGSTKEGVLAWKAIRAMEPENWNEDVLTRAKKTLYQLDKEHDSSSRTLAVDIILTVDRSAETLKNLIYFLLSDDKAFEVKQYLWQEILMIAQDDDGIRNIVLDVIKPDPKLNNYNILGQKGLSLALKRKFLDNGFSNGSLLTIQEMFGGIVKRGIVDVVMDKNEVSQEIFSLGIFSAGLGGFISTGSDSTGSNDVATAGMELAVLGTQIRPFTFFEGQGELMGHVWSGTASERTTAYQALALLQDHLQFLRLSPGFIAEVDVKGATSFDLSGKISFSLWNRNAESLVEKSAGFVFEGLTRVETNFVNSQVEFIVSIEPKLNLATDIDFYTDVNLCMKLTQPEAIFRHNVYKIERVPGSKHRLRKAIYRKYAVPGKTYALNKKNSEMCGKITK